MQSRTYRRILATALLLLSGASAGRADMAPSYGWRSRHRAQPCAAVRIHSVDSAQIDRRNGEVILSVSGEASSAGWRNASLRRVEPPAQEARETEAIYEFIACPPEVAVDVLTPIATTLSLPPPFADLRRIVVKAATNEKTVDFDGRPAQP